MASVLVDEVKLAREHVFPYRDLVQNGDFCMCVAKRSALASESVL